MVPAYLKHLLLPPASLFLLALLGLVLVRWRPVLGRFLMGFAVLGLYALSTPLVGGSLIAMVQDSEALTRFDHDTAAIVVLGAGNYTNAAEYGGDTVGATSLLRLRYGVRLHRLTGKPLMVTGGRGWANHPSEGEAMAQALDESFGVSAAWVEIQSANTYENAANSAAILQPLGITKIYLVTTGWHMQRAAATFEAAGFEVVPAPTVLFLMHDPTLASLMPSAESLDASATAIYEWLGLIWYRVAYF